MSCCCAQLGIVGEGSIWCLLELGSHVVLAHLVMLKRCDWGLQAQLSSPQEQAGLMASIAELRGAAVRYMRQQALQKQHAMQVHIRRQDAAHNRDQQVCKRLVK